jgi:hypothetical protein
VSVTRRLLLTATAAGTLLCALWFVPSAHATIEQSGAQQQSSVPAQGTAAGGPEQSETP